MAKIELQNILKVYTNGTKAVDNASLIIEDKEFVVLVGPSGCGKSTILRIIAGLEKPTDGQILVDGKIFNNLSIKKRKMSMVFQNHALFPHMSVFNNLAYSLKVSKIPKEDINKSVSEIAKTLGIEMLLKRKPNQLSGGQKQRVALGRAITRDSNAFLFDEPLSSLDTILRTQMRTELSLLHKKLQSTFIYVTHDQVEAMTMGTKIIVLKHGIIQQVDSPNNIYNLPKNKFVAEFIGTPKMNLFSCNIISNEKDLKIFAFGTELLLPKNSIPQDLKNHNKAWVGIRSEDVIIQKTSSEKTIPLTITFIEYLGGEKLLHCKTKTFDKFILKVVNDKEFQIEENIYISFQPDKLHFFDYTSEERIYKH